MLQAAPPCAAPWPSCEMQELLRNAKDCMSLSQGVVYWQPPQQALEKVQAAIWEPSTSNYGPDDGLPELQKALVEKLRRENKLCKSSVMVTAGANQAFNLLFGTDRKVRCYMCVMFSVKII